MSKYLALVLCFVATSAVAQSPPPTEQALANKLTAEINMSLQCQAALITATKELEELRKKELKDHNVSPPPAPSAPPPK